MNSLLKDKFSRRFIDNGRVLSTLDMQKQRVMGRVENVAYIALYDCLQDKWALVRNANASYPCYSLDDKGNPIVTYIDRMGNIRERVIKQEMFNEVLETSEGSQEFRDNLKATQDILKDYYTLEYIKPSLGYNLDGLPSSCQKGKGHFFKWCDEIAKMAILKDNKGSIVARCLIWDKENIEHNGEPCSRDIADRLYYHEGIHKIALKNELKKLNIDMVWENNPDDIPFEYQEYILKLPEQAEQDLDRAIEDREVSFLDTFNHYNESEGLLYSFYWSGRLSHESFEWDGDTTIVLLDTSGGIYYEDGEVWDDYNGEYISQDDAIEPLNYSGLTHRNNCVYSDYHGDYLLDDGDIICVRTPGGYDDYDYTFVGSGVELVEINDETYFLESLSRYRA
ncbi:hypothetical protein [Campylobacter vicugnae]|uniref:hypothetical protein n=1 Tax=Campylobacter vicugnae TaxID=1660076 RepID=UPI00254C8517|nr:hypothetical protein [Campylobacter ovis]MDL0105217.1 hypothetical protein [Campylobacter ovis]MDL0106636.1 hypothetical protein [Campylobacter ovis]